MARGIVRFAWKELLVSLRFWKRTGSPVQYDFIILTFCFFFSFLMVSLGALIELNGIAILERVLLGGVPGKGVPVYFRASSEIGVKGLDTATLKAFAANSRGVDVYPYWQFDLLDATELQMPGRALLEQGQSSSESTEESIFPRAIAISRDSPLWQDLAPGSKLGTSDGRGMEVIASRGAFKALGEKFYERYRHSALRIAPYVCPLQHHLPTTIARWDELDTLLLAEPERGGRRVLHPFKVTWVDSFPTPQEYALIVPLESFDLLKVIDNNNAVQVFFEGGGRSIQRVESASLHNIANDRRAGVEEFRRLAVCMGAQRDPQSTWIETWAIGDTCAMSGAAVVAADDVLSTLSLRLDRPMPLSAFGACVERSGILTAMKAVGRSDDFRPSFVEAPMSMAWRGAGDIRVCKVSVDKDCAPQATNKGDQAINRTLGNTHVIIFVPTDLSTKPLEEIAMEIERWKLDNKEVFALDPASRATLIRYGVLRKFIGTFGGSLAWTALISFAMFAGAFLGLMFDHRKVAYGVMMLHGVGVRGIVAVALLQTTVVLCLSAIAGFVAAYFVQELLYSQLNELEVVKEARRTIGLGHMRLLLPGFSTLLKYFALVVGAALAVLLALRLWSLRSIQSAGQLLRQ